MPHVSYTPPTFEEPGSTIMTILNDIALVTDLVAKITTDLATAKAVLSEGDLATAKARLAAIQMRGADLDAEFDTALAEARERAEAEEKARAALEAEIKSDG